MLNLREGPGAQYETIIKLPLGDLLYLRDVPGTWIYVVGVPRLDEGNPGLHSTRGWVNSTFLKKNIVSIALAP